MSSKALEVNIATSRVEVCVDPKYNVLYRVMEKYYGIRDSLKTFAEELCHPYKNWTFIVQEARTYTLNYFHLLKQHPEGPAAATIFMDTFFQAMAASVQDAVKVNAADNLLLFIQRIIKDAGSESFRFNPVLEQAFSQMGGEPENRFFIFVKSFYQINKIAKDYFMAAPEGTDFFAVNRLMNKYYGVTFSYWLGQENPFAAFEKEFGTATDPPELNDCFEPISHACIREREKALEDIFQSSAMGERETLGQLLELPGYGEMVARYGRIPRKILSLLGDNGRGKHAKLIFLLQIMQIAGLSAIHEETLRDINRTLAWLIQHEEIQKIHLALKKTFAMLGANVEKFPATVLNCVLNMGKGVYQTDESELVDLFVDSAVSLGFQAPEVKGVGSDWQLSVNPEHIRNIRVWLELIKLNPKWSKKLLSSLIINLCLTGVFIKDTDLFPRDITALLNSDLSPVYNLVKQLTRLFPCYFNDIGAEGRLREISTEIDEISFRKDVLVHFLRKQSHVESSNQVVRLIEAILEFWRTGKKEGVRPFVPPEIFEQVETEGPYIDGVREIVSGVCEARGFSRVTDLLQIKKEAVFGLKDRLPHVPEQDFERVAVAVELYKLLYQKYHLSFTDMDAYLDHLEGNGLPELKRLKKVLHAQDPLRKLKGLLQYLDKLKEVILSTQGYEIKEDIYRKRHFTVDIPSMYGSYHEMKFDALGLTFRLESLVNVLFEDIVESFDLTVITRATIAGIHEFLRLFDTALKLDGIISTEMERQLDVLAHALEIGSFSATQYLDIFRGFSQAVSNMVNDYFNNIHQQNLLKILEITPGEQLLPKYLPPEGAQDAGDLSPRVSEIFLRDRITGSLGLQQLDVFLTRILNTLHRQLRELREESMQLLLAVDPQKTVTSIHAAQKDVVDIIHLGNKGLNLVRMKQFGLPVPPGFIITTEVFKYREILEQYAPARESYEQKVALEINRIEKLTKKRFGHPKKPLLFSVRSGASISQPGMMDTFLDVGVNEDIVRGMAERTKNEWFSWDTYRRFLQSYGMAYGLSRDAFDELIGDHKKRAGIPSKRYFTGEQMKAVALKYKTMILDHGITVEEDPLRQLHIAIGKVFDSWDSSKAKTYRKIMGISDDWGTAVTLQSMVFGNLSARAGAGVFFTHNPRWSGDMILLWGDFTCGNQGEDIVSGLVSTMPISKRQAEIENRSQDNNLETLFPEIYRAMREWAKVLVYEKDWSPQEMEFTFEGPDPKHLYLLQTRDMVIREQRKSYAFAAAEDEGLTLLDHGIGVSGGAMSGRVVFSLEEIRRWRKREPDTPLIIVRADTVPDDIKEIHESDGLLTARGGSTSHAALVAYRLGKTCVVGCVNMICSEREGSCGFREKTLKSGEWISIDGLEGSVYAGRMKTREA